MKGMYAEYNQKGMCAERNIIYGKENVQTANMNINGKEYKWTGT